ncbi:hypothetical protein CI610_02889 [invertebrate metagenome]|uniref:Uncharacterized protein n=1 Tax=invertebrate metagenome TaxID=1711999 RepID=A0A2H9T4L9_9ZZZZ
MKTVQYKIIYTNKFCLLQAKYRYLPKFDNSLTLLTDNSWINLKTECLLW